MPVYISSNQNRFYCAAEGAYGQVPAITANQRIPAVKLAARQQLAVTTRKDKTGSRTFGVKRMFESAAVLGWAIAQSLHARTDPLRTDNRIR